MIRWTLPLALAVLLATVLARPSVEARAEAQLTGTIAYVRTGGSQGDQIRLIEPDGSGDRLLWAAPGADPLGVYEVSALAWRPDASELAFASDHEDGCSVFSSDLYGVRPDGSSERRLVNTPRCAELPDYPQGSVTVTVRNLTSSPESNFSVYVQGAPRPVDVLILPGATARVTVPSVADLGDLVQLVVVIRGDNRWVAGGVNIVPGQPAVPTPQMATIFGEGIPHFGAWYPSWRADGSALAYAQSATACLDVRRVPTAPEPPGRLGLPVLNTDREQPCSLAWAPNRALADQVMYLAIPGFGTQGTNIYRAAEGGRTSEASKLVTVEAGALLLWYGWLPDGSGLLFARTTVFRNTEYRASNIFHYDFGSGAIRQVTQFDDSFVRSFSIAPDGQSIVFERATTLRGSASDLWVAQLDGTGLRFLIAGGRLPTWSQHTPVASMSDVQVYLPQLLR
jgi:hypothetical protein